MTTYQCIDCELHYCLNCDDGGEDSCEKCHTGPRCNECAVDHAREHTTCGRCGEEGAAGAAGLCADCNAEADARGEA